MRILITGHRGQLGTDCLAVLGRRHEVLGGDLPELDITRADSVALLLDQFQPRTIVNCAAFTNVDRAETDRATAWNVNAEGPRVLAQEARDRQIRVVHVSTDYVFDGTRPVPLPYDEADTPDPLGYYGVTKLAGERAVADSGAPWAILRTAWLYGATGNNFLKTILRLARQPTPGPLRVVNDQHGSPTWSHRLAEQILTVIEAGATGLFHATAEGHCTWYELTVHFLKAMGVAREVVPCTSAEYPRPARRPHNSILENRRLKELNLNVMEDWRADVNRFVQLHGDRLLKETEKT